MDVEGLVEASLFISSKPLTVEELAEATKLRNREVREVLKNIISKWGKGAIEVVKIGNAYSMQVKEEYGERLRELAPPQIPEKLLKTLSLVAYHQPIRQVEIRDMVGRRAYDDLRQLEELEMVSRKPSGSTKIVKATALFNEYFGIGGESQDEIKTLLERKLDR